METQKIITYSAIGVAGIVCLVFLLDLAAGIFGRNIGMDIMFILGSGFLLWQGVETMLELALASALVAPLVATIALDQALPREFSRFDRDGPADGPRRLGRHRAQAREPNLAADATAQLLRQQPVQPRRDGRAGQCDPVDRAGRDPLDDRLGQRLGIDVVINGNLVDFGQLARARP